LKKRKLTVEYFNVAKNSVRLEGECLYPSRQTFGGARTQTESVYLKEHTISGLGNGNGELASSMLRLMLCRVFSRMVCVLNWTRIWGMVNRSKCHRQNRSHHWIVV